jgi:hypothetical protein
MQIRLDWQNSQNRASQFWAILSAPGSNIQIGQSAR